MKSHSLICSTFHSILPRVASQEEINRLKLEHENAIRDRNGLQQSCTQAVHKWNITVRERQELQEALKKVIFQANTAWQRFDQNELSRVFCNEFYVVEFGIDYFFVALGFENSEAENCGGG